MKILILIFTGAGLGAVARFALQTLCNKVWPSFPAGTLFVNLVGCLIMGAFLAYGHQRELAAEWKGFIGVGLLGGFTTFSAFAGESLDLLKQGSLGLFAIYALSSLGGCVLACAVGYALASRYCV